MSTFGDDDPEDGYDVTDPLELRLAVLERVVAALDTDDPARAAVRLSFLRRATSVARADAGALYARVEALIHELDHRG